jgi:hypothetical protein
MHLVFSDQCPHPVEADIDGSLALGVTAESAQDIARLLEKAASEMRLAL